MSNIYIGIDGEARKVNNIYVGVDGVAKKVKKGWIGVDGVARLFYQAAAANTIGSLSIGTEIYLTEENGDAAYIIIGKNHYGLGEITLLRKYTKTYGKYHSSKPSSAYSNKYSNSSLERKFDTLYSNLPTETQAKIITTPLPCYSNASAADTGITLDVYLFALSAAELAGTDNINEGVWFENVFPDENSRKATSADGTARAYWTRTPVPGMADYCRVINTSGILASASCAVNQYMRPACNVLATQEVYIDTDGNYHI